MLPTTGSSHATTSLSLSLSLLILGLSETASAQDGGCNFDTYQGPIDSESGVQPDLYPTPSEALPTAGHPEHNTTRIVPVYFHFVQSSAAATPIPAAALQTQIALLNSRFDVAPQPPGQPAWTNPRYQFALLGADRIINDQWSDPFSGINFLSPESSGSNAMTSLLSIEPARVLNVYVLPQGIRFGNTRVNGAALLPYPYDYGSERGVFPAPIIDPPSEDDPQDDPRWGIFLDVNTLPGGMLVTGPQDGTTFVHEVGHYLGLLHVDHFGRIGEGSSSVDCPYHHLGCAVSGDFVCDTAAIPKDDATCPMPNTQQVCMNEVLPPNPDNVMAIGSNTCRTLFTNGGPFPPNAPATASGQVYRMAALGYLLKPALGEIVGPVPLASFPAVQQTGSSSTAFVERRLFSGVWATPVATGLTVPGHLTTDPGVEVRVAPNQSVVVNGSLTSFETTFTASDPSAGWYGMWLDGGASVLDAVLISGVSYAGVVLKKSAAAVTVSNGAHLSFRNGSVLDGALNAQGIEAVGRSEFGYLTEVVIEDLGTIVRGSQGVGVSAQGGAQVVIHGQAQITSNGGGVLAGGYGSNITLDRALIESNLGGPGVYATGGGVVRSITPGIASVKSRVNGNQGGLYAYGGGSIRMGDCIPYCANHNNQIRDNAPVQSSFYDASALVSSTVIAQGNDWGVSDEECVRTQVDGKSTVLVAPIISVGQPCTAQQTLGRAAATAPVSAADTDLASAVGTSGQKMSDAVLALIVAAEQAYADGDEATAFATLHAALIAAVTVDDRDGAYAGAARLLAQAQPAATVTFLDAATAGDTRPWALSALAVAHASANRPTEADAAAAALASDQAGTDFGAFALGVRARLAAEAGAEMDALGHLADLYAVAPESHTFLTAVSVVGAAFPDADLPGALLRGAASAGKGGTAAVNAEATARGAALSVRPNPASASVRVTLGIETAATLSVSVFDALGRRVAVVAEGEPVAEGLFTADLSVADLPAGVYLVRATQRTASGLTTVSAARLTVLR